MTRLLPALALALPALVRAQAPAADTSLALAVTLDRVDWKYAAGDTARFTVTMRRVGRVVPGARVVATLAPIRMPAWRVDTLDLSSGAAVVRATSPRPDFVKLTVRPLAGGAQEDEAMATAAFSPERIASRVTAPADFDAFWAKAVADARRVPLAPVMTRVAERSTPEVDVYHVSFQNHRAGSRLYGMLSVPTAPGKYPVMLSVPGAGVRPYFPNVSMARRGVVHLAIGIHGIPVHHDSLVYNELRAAALQRYFTYNLDDRDEYYYRRVYVGTVRAGDFLMSLPQADTSRYLVQGSSQGGGLALVAGALDPRVKWLAVSYPALADQLGYREGRAGGWPHLWQDTTRLKAAAEKAETIRYYDAVNFARRVRAPGIYLWGYNDAVVPPHASYAAYHAVTAPKEAVIAPEAAHFHTPAMERARDAWIRARLGVM